MSGNKLIDDYLSDLMDDGDGAAPPPTPPTVAAPPEPAPGATPAVDVESATDVETATVVETAAADAAADSTDDTSTDGAAGPGASDPSAADIDAAPESIAAQPPSDDALASLSTAATTTDAIDASDADEPVADAVADTDLLAGFRSGGGHISDDEFEAMLDVLAGKSPPPDVPATDSEPAAPTGPAGDPLAAFRAGGNEISEDEFEAMLDALSGQSPAMPLPAAPEAASRPAALPTHDPAADDDADGDTAVAVTAPPRRAAPVVTPGSALAELIASTATVPAAEPSQERRHRRAEERVTSWLRFSIARQSFAVEVLKVQEVLRLPTIMPVRGTERAMLGAMNLRGQIVPVMDLAMKLGFPVVERTEASRIIVLEEHGETLGLLVASVADVANVSDARIERISGTPSLVAAEVVRGIARRDGNIIILLDASRLLA